jgi:hypothetical protein
MNTFYCIGTLIGEPLISNKEGKKPFCRFNMVIDDCQTVEVKCYDDQAEACAKYLTEHRKVLVIGRAYPDTYNKGQQVYPKLVVKADDIEFLLKKA